MAWPWLHPEKYFRYNCFPSYHSSILTSSSLPEASQIVEEKPPGRCKGLLQKDQAEESLVIMKKFRLSGLTDAALSNQYPIFLSRLDKLKYHFPATINYPLPHPRCQLHT